MLKKARQAFRGLTDLFEFGDGASLTNVDIGAGFATLDGMGPWLRTVGLYKEFILLNVDAVGATAISAADVKNSGDWTNIVFRGQELAGGAGGGAVDPDNDFIVLTVGAQITSTANFTSVDVNYAGSIAAGAWKRLLWHADAASGTGNIFHADGPTEVVSFPVFVPQGVDDDGAEFNIRFANSGANDTTVIISILEFPRGLWVPR